MLNRRNYILAVSLIGVVIASSVNAAQIQLQMRLLSVDDDSEIAPGSGGVYTLPARTNFKVGIYAQVLSPTITDTLRTGATMDSKPLGISVLNTNIVSSTLSGVSPVIDPTDVTPPLSWHPDFITTGLPGTLTPALPISVGDVNGDLIPDVNGARFANLSLTLSTAGALPNFQTGALGDYVMIVSGAFHVNAAIPGSLSLQTLAAGLFSDPAGGAATDLASDDVSSTVLNASVINFGVPEPMTNYVLGVGAVFLAGFRRHRA